MSSVEPTQRGRRVVAAVVAAAVLVVVVAVAALALIGRGSARENGSLGASTSPAASATDQETTGSRTSPPSNSSPTATEKSGGGAGAGETTSASLDETAETGQGVTVKVTKIEQVQGQANGPGEVAGPAVRLTVQVANRSPKQLSMELALVNVYYGKARTPAASLSGPGADALAGSIHPGESASGRYVFRVPRSKQDQLTVEFSYTTDAPTVIFSE